MKKTLLALAMMMATGSVYASPADATAATGDSVTAVTILSAGQESGASTAATDDDTLTFINNNGSNNGSAVADGGTATLNSQNVDNPIETNSFNAVTKGSSNATNSFNATTIGGDGNVVHANDMDQAVAESDLNVHLIDNEVNIAGGQVTDLIGAQTASPATNANLNLNYLNTNEISASYARLSGVSSLQFNSAHAANVQQSIVVASDVGL